MEQIPAPSGLLSCLLLIRLAEATPQEGVSSGLAKPRLAGRKHARSKREHLTADVGAEIKASLPSGKSLTTIQPYLCAEKIVQLRLSRSLARLGHCLLIDWLSALIQQKTD